MTAVSLIFDFMLNNLKMKFSHWKLSIFFSLYFIILTLLGERISH
jgi:hypothetical protein